MSVKRKGKTIEPTCRSGNVHGLIEMGKLDTVLGLSDLIFIKGEFLLPLVAHMS